MILWILLLLTAAALGVGSLFYLITRVRRFVFMQKLAQKSKLLSWLAAIALVGLLFLFWLVNLYAVVIAVLHVALIWLLCELVFRIVRRIRKRPFRRYAAGIAAAALSAAVLLYGWIAAHHVFRTGYTIESASLNEPLRIALIADSHLGITFDGNGFAREMQRLNAESPDLVVLVGDFVDDDSEREDMLESCRALGSIEAPYGVYFVYGNHDNGYYQYRNFSSAELREALTANGVTVLEDVAVPIRQDVTLIGRRDRSMRDRLPVSALLADGAYQIVLDHQPNDYAAEAAAGADLVLSGHTHGGHLFPAGQIGLLLGANDAIYGQTQRGDTTFIVTSGLSGWAIPFKTGTFSEYVILDLIQKGADS